ncbi:hypothetical protein ABIE19_000287 [Brevundimonas faecalis]|uniref:Uncharacterized protein n=1 Tax=Brevundimonas faecalis TaxID=947378 RepID=A0ABV2R8S9_9CAUL
MTAQLTVCALTPPPFTGEGDRGAVEGAAPGAALKRLHTNPNPETVARSFAPSTMLRMVPLPRCAGEERRGAAEQGRMSA